MGVVFSRDFDDLRGEGDDFSRLMRGARGEIVADFRKHWGHHVAQGRTVGLVAGGWAARRNSAWPAAGRVSGSNPGGYLAATSGCAAPRLPPPNIGVDAPELAGNCPPPAPAPAYCIPPASALGAGRRKNRRNNTTAATTSSAINRKLPKASDNPRCDISAAMPNPAAICNRPHPPLPRGLGRGSGHAWRLGRRRGTGRRGSLAAPRWPAG